LKIHSLLRIILVFISSLMLIGFIFLSIGYRLVTRSLPETSGAARCEGLRTDVEIFRDDLGIPYVIADNEGDLFFSQGYITAQDRFFQMDLNRHLVRGQLSGLLQVKELQTDTLMRRVDLIGKAGAEYQNLPANIHLIFQRYADGVNAYLDQYEEKLPIEYTLLNRKADPWLPEESLALLYLHAWLRQSEGLLQVLTEMDEKEGDSKSEEKIQKLLKEGLLHLPPLSNLSWIVSGEKSASGKPIMAAVYNEPAVLPNVWYEIQLFSKEFCAGGLSLPGVPMIWTGRNGAVAWASNVRQSWAPIPVAGAESTSDFVRRLCAVMRSTKVMEQPGADSGWFILSADTSGGMDVYPRPAQGRVNGKGWIATDGARVVTDRDSVDHNAWQLRRLADLLNADSAFTPYRMRQIQSDCRSKFAVDVLKHALPILENVRQDNPVAEKILEQWSVWNGEMRPGSSEALVFQTWLSLLLKQRGPDILTDDLPQISYTSFLEGMSRENKEENLKQTFLEAIRMLREKRGDDVSLWSWGAARNVRFMHPLRGNPLLDLVMNLGPFHFGGSAVTLCGAGHSITDPERIEWIQSARIILPLDNVNRTFSALSTGQSGQPVDTHYRDQIALFLSQDVHPNLTDIDRIRRSGWEQLTLNPGGQNDEKK
jgi:acyl-homoserine lactone acylase PvdQ